MVANNAGWDNEAEPVLGGERLSLAPGSGPARDRLRREREREFLLRMGVFVGADV